MLEQFKKDARTLFNRGHLNQKQCCDILGLKEPFGPVLKVVVHFSAFICRKLVVYTEPKDEIS